MLSIEELFKRLFPKFYSENESMFNDISKIGYVGVDEYKQDIRDIQKELEEVDMTISYYKERKSVLLDWKHKLEVKINKLGEMEVCCDCRFYNNGYCRKFAVSVDDDAVCDDFDWK